MPLKRRAFKTTRLKVNDLHPEAKEELQGMYTELEAARTDATAAARKAITATNIARIKRSEALNKEMAFLERASSYFNEVSYEQVWLIFRDKNGEVILESPFTEKIQRNLIRAQNQMMEKQLDEEDGASDYYEDTEEDGNSSEEGDTAA